MKISMHPTSMLIVIMSGVILAGCGNEPSQHDIETAIAQQQQGIPKEMQGLVPEIKSAKKIACKADGEKAYICDLEIEVQQLGTTNKGVTPVRFVKASNGWTATK